MLESANWVVLWDAEETSSRDDTDGGEDRAVPGMPRAAKFSNGEVVSAFIIPKPDVQQLYLFLPRENLGMGNLYQGFSVEAEVRGNEGNWCVCPLPVSNAGGTRLKSPIFAFVWAYSPTLEPVYEPRRTQSQMVGRSARKAAAADARMELVRRWKVSNISQVKGSRFSAADFHRLVKWISSAMMGCMLELIIRFTGFWRISWHSRAAHVM